MGSGSANMNAIEQRWSRGAVQRCHELYVKLVEGEIGNSRKLAESIWPFDVQ